VAWAAGYFAEPNYYVAGGPISGIHDLGRARRFIDPDGRFVGARFQLRSAHPEFLKNVSWAWDRNPFVGTPQLEGLKILTMLLSDWDNKDLHDAPKLGSNIHIFRDGDRYLFFVDDWGRTMGRWGGLLHRSAWNAADYFRQTPKFVNVRENGEIRFGYKGQHTEAMKDVTSTDVRWLLQYLGRVTDTQIREGLLASGATRREADLFTGALRTRIRQLNTVATLRSVPRPVASAGH
jgi:hypothetical protein